jgi:hypothetical protein
MKDLTNQRFGRLVAQWPAGKVGRQVKWLCLCDCGALRIIFTHSLTSKKTRSCGCLLREQASRCHTTHGHGKRFANGKRSPEWQAYQNAKQRCTNPKTEGWYLYGGRGIEFRFASFEEFLAAVGLRPKGVTKSGRPLYSIDRYPNNDGHYESKNLRWATGKDQQANRRNTRTPELPLAA